MRHLFTLALGGLLGIGLLAGDAEACHKKSCGGGCGRTKAVCAQPRVACARPVVKSGCGQKANKCGSLFHNKRSCTSCSQPVMACNSGYAAPMATGQYMAPMATGQYTTPMATGQYTTPMTSGQYMTAPGKAMGR